MNVSFENLEFGDFRIFNALSNSNNNIFADVYSSLLNELLNSNFWSENTLKVPRVLWQNGRDVRNVQKELFSKSGLYLWGADNIPRYIGKTHQSFNKRFNRYIWGKKSQCNLAQEYEKELEQSGLDGFPQDILDWYKKNYGNSKVRLQGAVDFAEQGLKSIWFALFPTDDLCKIDEIEKKLIPVANEWNIRNNYAPLINIQYN